MEAEKIAQKVRLVVSKASPELGLTPAQIAQRLELELIATLPERRVALGQAMNQGHLLAEAAPRDPYVRALDLLVTRLAGAPAEQGADGKPRKAAKAAKVAKATKATKADDAADAAMPTPPPRARGKSALDAFRRFLPTSSKRS
jgi:pilus assembly protein CpaE